jgi:hypothetical protein
MLEWYRADPAPRIRRALVMGPSALTLGGLVVAVSFVPHTPAAACLWATVLGLLLTAGGAMFTVLTMHKILREDATLAIRTDGIALQAARAEAFFAWDTLASARWDTVRGVLVLERTGACPDVVVPHRFRGIGGPAIALRVEHSRRRAALGLLR